MSWVGRSTLRLSLEKAFDVRMAMESGVASGVAWIVQIKCPPPTRERVRGGGGNGRRMDDNAGVIST